MSEYETAPPSRAATVFTWPALCEGLHKGNYGMAGREGTKEGSSTEIVQAHQDESHRHSTQHHDDRPLPPPPRGVQFPDVI